jgi:plastocyanin
MSETVQPGGLARRVMLRRALGVGIGGVVAAITVQASRADDGSQVVVDNFAFVPSTLKVKTGTKVTWTNHDDIPHSVVCPALNFHSHPMDTNDSVSFTFTKPGQFTYVCGLHPFMHGQVVVTA